MLEQWVTSQQVGIEPPALVQDHNNLLLTYTHAHARTHTLACTHAHTHARTHARTHAPELLVGLSAIVAYDLFCLLGDGGAVVIEHISTI